MCDDIFDDSDSENVVLEKSWERNVTDLNKEGYREGVDAGKEESVQAGFNDAFAAASTLLFQAAKLRGNIGGRLSMNLLRPGTLQPETESQLQEILQDVCALESDLLNFSPANLAQARRSAMHSHTDDPGTHGDSETGLIESDTSEKSERIQDTEKNECAAGSAGGDIEKSDGEECTNINIVSSEKLIKQTVDTGKVVNDNERIDNVKQTVDPGVVKNIKVLGENYTVGPGEGDRICVDNEKLQTETRLASSDLVPGLEGQTDSRENLCEPAANDRKTSEDPVRFKQADDDAGADTGKSVVVRLKVLAEKYKAIVG